MKKQIAALVFLIISTISFAGDGIPYSSLLDSDNEKTEYLISNKVMIKPNVILPGMGAIGILYDPNNKVYTNSNPIGGNNWVSKTISVFGSGFNLVGINIKMSKFDFNRKSGWVDKKEWNLNADKTRNGLSLKYKF